MDCSPPGSSVHGILQARILEWVAIPFSGGSSWPRDWTQVSCIAGLFFTTWAILYQLRASLVVQLLKNLSAMWETWVYSLAWEDPLKKRKATHSSILAWRIPWMVYSVGLQRVRHDWAIFTSLHFTYELSHKGSPRILEWVAYPFSSRSSLPRNRTGVSCIAGRFLVEE